MDVTEEAHFCFLFFITNLNESVRLINDQRPDKIFSKY